MKTSFIVIDDFYDDPYEVREAALASSHQSRGELKRCLVEGLDERISRLMHEPVVASQSTAHGEFRHATLGGDERTRLEAHWDGECYWSGLVYLSLPEHRRGGAGFYRHIELSSVQVPISNGDVNRYRASDCATFTESVVRRDGIDASNRENQMTIPLRFNRCVLFRPWVWHMLESSFGDGPVNGALVQMFVFCFDESKRAKGLRFKGSPSLV